MTDTTFIPDYLKPALERLAAARAAHLEQARLMEDTLTAITRGGAESRAEAGQRQRYPHLARRFPCRGRPADR